MTTVPSLYKYQRSFWSISSACVVMVFLYMYFVGITVNNTLARQNAEKRSAELSTTLSELEFSYLSLKSSINEQMAVDRGFVEAKDTIIAKASNSEVSFRR